jgi:Zn finger protein HypA/HybF involved in hydrogenase expression
MRVRIAVVSLVAAALAACSAGAEPRVVPKPKIAKAGLLPSKELPAERDGVRVEDTGAVMFVCSNSDKHEDKEVLLSRCPDCSQVNYFYWDGSESAFRCYACLKFLDNEKVRCPECGKPPRVVRTKNKPKAS